MERSDINIRIRIAAAAVLCVSFQADAQDEFQEDQAEIAVLEVVGSRIRRGDIEGPEPVIVITADDMENAGLSTIQEVLDALPQNTGGGFDQSFVFGFTPSASAVDVRGFGVGRVLILLDGRRIPVFPFAAGGTTNFIDLNSIPSAAIERIEILPAGASAVYGSDAISGVINVVLRKDVEGTTFNVRYGASTHGGGETSRVQVFHGTTTNQGGTSVILEYFELDEIMAGQRSYAANDVVPNVLSLNAGPNGNGSIGEFSGFSPAGTLVDLLRPGVWIPGPDCTANPNGDFIPPGVLETGGSGVDSSGHCRYNRSRFRQLLPRLDRISGILQTERVLTPDVSFFGRASFLQGSVEGQIEPMPLIWADGTSPVVGCSPILDVFFGGGFCGNFYDADPNDPRDGIANNPNDISNGGFLLPAVRRRLQEWGPRRSESEVNQWSILFGLEGVIANRFNFEVGIGWYEIDLDQHDINYAREDVLREAIGTGAFNIFQPAPADLIARSRIDPTSRGESSITTLDFDITGDLWSMRNGVAQFAAVVEVAREDFNNERDPDLISNNTIALGGTSGGGGRDRWGIGAELLLPVHPKINLHLALRRDEYSDASEVADAIVPRVAFEYRPTERLLLRGHMGESFRAPDLQRLFGANTRAFDDVIDTPVCVANGGVPRGADPTPGDGFNECLDPVISAPVLLGSSRDLMEEEGEDWGLGVVWEVTDNLTFSTDLFGVSLQGLVRTPGTQFILDNAPAFPGSIQRNLAQLTPENPGGLALVTSTATNIGERRTRGADVLFEYVFETNRFGLFDVDVGATYTDLLEEQLAPGEPYLDLAEIAQWRATARMDWVKGNWGASIWGQWLESYAQFIQTGWQSEVASRVIWNTQMRWRTPWNAVIRVGLNNVFDEDPPVDFQDGNAGWPWYSQFYQSPFGRTWFTQYTHDL